MVYAYKVRGMPVEDSRDEYKHRHHIDGVPHCPECGGLLWPPKYSGAVISEDGVRTEDILDADPTDVYYHERCYDAQFNGGTERHEPVIAPEQDTEKSLHPPYLSSDSP